MSSDDADVVERPRDRGCSTVAEDLPWFACWRLGFKAGNPSPPADEIDSS